MENIITNIGTARFKSKTNNGESANYCITVANSTEFPEFVVVIKKRVLTTDWDLYKHDFILRRIVVLKGTTMYYMEQTMGIRKQSFDVINACVDQIVRTHRNSLNQIHSN